MHCRRSSSMPFCVVLIGVCQVVAAGGNRFLPAAVAADVERAALEEIIVTARRRTESLQETPMAVSVLSAAELEQRNLTNLMEVGAFAPNVSMAVGQGGSAGANNGQIFIRGVGQIDFLLTTDPGVGIYIDGVYHPRSLGAVMDLLDLERIEILRGPQGTLYGRNTIGGAVHVISSLPGETFGASVEATAGNFRRTDVRARVEGPLGTSGLRARAAVSYKDRAGYGKRLDFATGQKLDEAGDEHQGAGRVTLHWPLSDALTLDVALDYARWRQNALPEQLLYFDDAGEHGGVPAMLWNALVGLPGGVPMSSAFVTSDPDTTFGTGPNLNTLDQRGVAATIGWDAGQVAFRSVTALRAMEGRFANDGDGSPLPYIHTDNRQDHAQLSQELQVSGFASSDRLRWLAGLYYYDERGRDRNDVVLGAGLFDALETMPAQLTGHPCEPPFLAPGCAGNPINVLLDLELDVFNRIEIKSIAGFGHAAYGATDRLSLAMGLRYTHEEKTYTLEHRRLGSGVHSVPRARVQDSWSRVTPTSSIQYRWREALMTYLSVARGFKSGGFNGRPTTAAEVESFDPELLTAFEAGLKSDWLERRLRMNAAAYVYWYDDLQFTAVSADPGTGTLLVVVDNAAAAKVRGFEVELYARPTQRLDLVASGGLTRFEISRLKPGVLEARLDSQMPRAPRRNGAAGIQYSLPWRGSGEIRLRGDWTYESRSFSDIQNTPMLARPSHVIFNARVTLLLPAEGRGRGLQAAFFGTNLTDKRVLVNGIAGLDSFGTAEGFFNRPREWGVSVRKSF